jgi:hypothetical protein
VDLGGSIYESFGVSKTLVERLIFKGYFDLLLVRPHEVTED